MATINYAQALTKEQQKNIRHKDLECYVNYMHHFILEDTIKYDPLMFIFKYGMPGKTPEGRWGFTFNGHVKVSQRPIVQKHDWRIAPRHGEMERYSLELGSLFRLIAPITDYYEYNSQSLVHPEQIRNMHLAALSRTIPLYHKYILYKIFAGEKYKQKNTFLKQWFETYIEPSDGTTNGYAFSLSEGSGEINLTPVIKPSKVTVNELKNRLEAMGAALRDDSRKVEVDPAQDPYTKTQYNKQNLIPENLKTLALFNKVVELTNDIVRDGKFPDKKYMHKDFKALWYRWDTGDTTRHLEQIVKFKNAKGEEVEWDKWDTPITSPDQLVVLFSSKAWEKLRLNQPMSNPVTSYVDPSMIKGQVIFHDIIDEGEAIIMHRDLFQAWIIPQSVGYYKEHYGPVIENTTDYIHTFDHSLDLIPLHSSIYVKLKDS